jgi:protease PrsW
MPEFYSVGLALAGGITPALLWLWFWHREDSQNPEPAYLIFLAFIAGMMTVALVIPMQKFAATLIVGSMATFVAWSFIEEIMKYLVARITVLKNVEVNEPIDVVMYMVTIALGFAAVENALFLLSPLAGENILETVLTGNLRFVGATLLHVLSSAVVGIALAISFYKPKKIQILYALSGVILAAILHSGFNILILNTSDEHLFRTFALVWVGVVAVLALLEFVKRIRRKYKNI